MTSRKHNDETATRGPSSSFQDWFLSALISQGSLEDALQRVHSDLQLRLSFVSAIKAVLYGRKPESGLDVVTRLSQRICALERTLKARLDMLIPEREGAWFRVPPVSQGGPFSGVLLEEPVFAVFSAQFDSSLRKALIVAWQGKRSDSLPFRDQSPCLWRTLLQLNQEIAAWGVLPAPFEMVNLREENPRLPQEVLSPSLAEFLKGVRREILRLEGQLIACYDYLRVKCEPFWKIYEKKQKDSERSRQHYSQEGQSAYSCEKRSAALRYKSPKDIAALKFMGFDDFPDSAELKKRYLALAKTYHPDLEGGNEQAFKELHHSYSYLVEKVNLK